ncbi:hypothetical protein DFH28DRAFT_949979 [Melampsora americana]|nr:hypothetical protein DFH28DRAFT_949979 [Melampsora americana]
MPRKISLFKHCMSMFTPFFSEIFVISFFLLFTLGRLKVGICLSTYSFCNCTSSFCLLLIYEFAMWNTYLAFHLWDKEIHLLSSKISF